MLAFFFSQTYNSVRLLYGRDRMPKFQKEFPKNALHFFAKSSDNAYKRAHPVKYAIIVTCGLIALVLPLFVLIFVTQYWYPAPNSGFLIMTMAGAFIIGVGLFNIVAAWMNQYLGHWVTAGSILIGSILIGISLIIIYIPSIYAKLDERMVNYYFTSLVFMAILPIFYISFRFAVTLRLIIRQVDEDIIDKLMKGRRNFWWYEALHQEVNLGLIYHINKLITILYPINLVLSLCLGWLRYMAPIVTGLYAIISIIIAGMLVFHSIQKSIFGYGKPFIILRISKSGLTSSFFDLLQVVFSLGLGYRHILNMLDVLGITR